MSNRLALLSLVAVASACQPSPGAVKSEDGKDRFKVQDAIFVPLSVDGVVVGGDIVIADQPDLCDTVRRGVMPSRMKALTFRVARLTKGSYLAPDVGEYDVVGTSPTEPGNFALAELVESDLNCSQTLTASESALNSGSVKITSLDPNEDGLVRGEFLVRRLLTGEYWSISNTAKGTFSAQYCPNAVQKLSCR